MEDVFDQLGRARRIEHHACLPAEIVDLREDAVEMDRNGRLCPDKEVIGSGLGEVGEIASRLDDHQVHIERLLRGASHRLDNHRSDRDVRYEAAVLDIDMDPVASRRIDGANLSARRPKCADKIDGATMIDLGGAVSGMAALALNVFHPGLATPHKCP